MPSLLPPTVGERLAQCGTSVEVWGITPGASVTLEAGGAAQTSTVNATGFTFTVAPLAPKAKVRAMQKLGGDASLWSAVAIAEEVALPPGPPATEPAVARCSQTIFAWGVAPGSLVEVIQGTNVVAAKGVANRAGAACMPVLQPPPASYSTRTTTCGAASPAQGTIAVEPPPAEIPPPRIVQPLFECQNVVHFEQLLPGAGYEIFVRDKAGVEASLGTFVACTSNMYIGVGRRFEPKDKVKAIGAMENDRWQCRVRGVMSAEVEAEPPDDRIKPVVDDPVWEGDPLIFVSNQIEGGRITLMRKEDVFDVAEELLGSRPSSTNPEVPPGVPLVKDNVLWVVQQLCNEKRSSEPVIVRGPPPQLPAPRLRRPVYACSDCAIVDGMLDGATAWVYQVPKGMPGPEILLGKMKAKGDSVVVPLYPRPSVGHELFAKQSAGLQFGPPSARVDVEFREDVPPPAIVEPVRPGDTKVWCDNLIVGAHVRLLRTISVGGVPVAVQIGAGTAIRTKCPIGVWTTVPDGALVSASQSLCREGRASREVKADRGKPCAGPPVYDPGKWNDGGTHELNNNCYNYACDVLNDTYAQPGPGGTIEPDCECHIIAPRAIGDGLDPCTDGHCHPCHHKVALVMDPGGDYHWYRQDADGKWSHKLGDSPATNLDSSQQPISNPETCNRGRYTVFCGYFCVYKGKVNIS